MIRLFLAISIFGLLADNATIAQDTTRHALPFEQWVFKFSPLVALDPEPSLMFGAEYVFHPRWSFQQELGYGYYDIWQINNDRIDQPPKSVIRLRSEMRRYFNIRRTNPRGGYLALDVFYKRAGHRREMETNQGNFFQFVEVRQIKNVTGMHLKTGFQFGEKLLVDIFVGVGFRVVFIRTPGRPADVDLNRFLQAWSGNFGDFIAPSITMGLKLGLPWQPSRTKPADLN